MDEPGTEFVTRIRNRELLLGTVVSMRSPEVTEALARCGFDWLFIDAEHGAFDPADALPLLQAAGHCPCLIRVPAHDEVWLKKALDIGPAGIIVPQVNTAEEAAAIIARCKYPPHGTRGMGVSRASGYGANLAAYIQHANASTAIVLQAEHRVAAANIESIAGVDGLDAILVGPFDLSASFGKPGQLSDPQVVAAIEKVTRTCMAGGIALATAVASVEQANTFIDNGYSLVAVGVDSLHLIERARSVLDAVSAR